MKKIISVLCMMLFFQLVPAGLDTSASAAKSAADQKPLSAASSKAQKLCSSAKNNLLQLRVLIRDGRAMKSMGSGFLIGTSNLVVTNYHVISQVALKRKPMLENSFPRITRE